MTAEKRLPLDKIEFVKELYPRLREDEDAIERYRASLELLPAVAVARGRVLVDGFHRWQAHKRENAKSILVEDLGDLTDTEIVLESIRRNSSHGQQLSSTDKRRLAAKLWLTAYGQLPIPERERELMALLSVAERTVQLWTKDARDQEKKELQARARDRWLDCLTQQEVADELGVAQKTISEWLSENRKDAEITKPPGFSEKEKWGSVQHTDLWRFASAKDEAGSSQHFGRLPAQVVENLLWFYTEPDDIVVDLFAGGGTTIDVAKAMGRRVWASDLTPSTPNLPIHEHDVAGGWPADAPARAKLVLLDPPYWKQAEGRYSDSDRDLGNMTYEAFLAAWALLVKACAKHLADDGRLAFIVGTTLVEHEAVHHAPDMREACLKARLREERHFIVPYTSEQLTGGIIEAARKGRFTLATYRDLLVFRP